MKEKYNAITIKTLIGVLGVISIFFLDRWVLPQERLQDEIYAYKKIVIPIEIKSGSTGSLRSLHQFIDASTHSFAIRVYGGEFRLEKTVTPAGKPYLLLNLPYYLGTRIAEYAEWLTNQSL